MTGHDAGIVGHPSSTVNGHFQPSPEFRVYMNQALT